MSKALAFIVVFVATLAACSGGSGVDWDSYAPAVKTRIDTGSCGELQQEFNVADANRSTDLMAYIDDTMRSKGCYQ